MVAWDGSLPVPCEPDDFRTLIGLKDYSNLKDGEGSGPGPSPPPVKIIRGFVSSIFDLLFSILKNPSRRRHDNQVVPLRYSTKDRTIGLPEHHTVRKCEGFAETRI